MRGIRGIQPENGEAVIRAQAFFVRKFMRQKKGSPDPHRPRDPPSPPSAATPAQEGCPLLGGTRRAATCRLPAGTQTRSNPASPSLTALHCGGAAQCCGPSSEDR